MCPQDTNVLPSISINSDDISLQITSIQVTCYSCLVKIYNTPWKWKREELGFWDNLNHCSIATFSNLSQPMLYSSPPLIRLPLMPRISDLITGVASLEGDSLLVFYYLSAFEIYPDKRVGLYWEWPHKKGEGASWLWLHGSLIYNYLCNQWLSSLTWVWIPLKARCTRYNIMWSSLSVTCCRSVVYSGTLVFLHQ